MLGREREAKFQWKKSLSLKPEPIDQKNNQKVEEKVQQDTIAPTINQPKTIKNHQKPSKTTKNN